MALHIKPFRVTNIVFTFAVAGCSSYSATNIIVSDAGTDSGGTAGAAGASTASGKTGGAAATTGGKSSTGGAGGAMNSGGTSSVGGSSSAAGSQSLGGNSGIAGSQSTGASSGIAGSQSTGGMSSSGGTSGALGGTSSLGGTTSQSSFTGGAPPVGGSATGGKTATGGSSGAVGGAVTGGAATGGKTATGGSISALGGSATGGAPTGGAPPTGGAATGGASTGGTLANGQSCAGDNQCASDHCVSGICCNIACGVCNSCSTGTCVPVTSGTSCGSGQVCSGGNCQAGCWIGGGFRSSGETSGNCQICDPTKSTTAWSNNDSASVSCGSCGGTATCVNMQLGPCSKVANTYWQDHDGDGYGNPLIAGVQACAAPAGFVANSGDCDDSDSTWYPGRSRCETFDALTTCTTAGTNSTTSCANGCAGGECRSFGTVSTAGSVTCGTLTCSTSSGCSFTAPLNTPPSCGTSGASWYETCDGPNDCSGGQVCCHVMPTGGNGEETICMASGSCPYGPNPGGSGRLVCDTLGSACATGGTCAIAASYLSIYECQ